MHCTAWRKTILRTPLILIAAAVPALAATPKLPVVAPSSAGMAETRLAFIDKAVEDEIAAKKLPGCVVLIGRQGKIAWLKAYGNKQLEPEPVATTIHTVFDLASLTKPVATATSVMILVEEGKLQVRDRVAQYIPEFAQNGKDRITVLQLLTHQSGLIADNALSDFDEGPERAFERIDALRPQADPGSKFIYSDVGFIVLGELVKRLSGKNVHEYSHERIFGPLRMNETGYLPGPELRARAAPTERRGGEWMQGEVHDPRA